jgi:hypothetical protein
MTVRRLDENNSSNRPEPLAAGRFGIRPGLEPRPYHPVGCPSLDQFEAKFQRAAPMREDAGIEERV